MKTKLLLLVVSALAFGSCTTMYKTGQTPDDVYYSPARNIGAAVAEKRSEPAEDDGEYYVVNNNDRMIRMGINDYRWRYLNNDWAYSPYSYYNNYGSFYNNYGSYGGHGYYNDYYGSYYNPYYNGFSYNNYYYNPYYSPYPVYITPSNTIKTSTPRVTNLNGYSHNYNNANTSLMPSGNRPPVRSYNNSNGRTSAVGEVLNRVLAPSSTNNNNSYNNTTNRTTTTERTYTPPPPSNNNSSSGSSSSGGGGGRVITRPN